MNEKDFIIMSLTAQHLADNVGSAKVGSSFVLVGSDLEQLKFAAADFITKEGMQSNCPFFRLAYCTDGRAEWLMASNESPLQAFSQAADRYCIIIPQQHEAYINTHGAFPPVGFLRYIDGCMNNCLYQPTIKGNTCLNALYIPQGVHQTPHTHPSERVGMIVQGSCMVKIGEQYLQLRAGDVWAMKPNVVHSFHTELGESCQLFAFHPDSDFGPTHEIAPMINRTLVDGIAAINLPSIHTKHD